MQWTKIYTVVVMPYNGVMDVVYDGMMHIF